MKVLIAVVTCHKYRSRMLAQLETWASEPMPDGIDLRFFLGHGESLGTSGDVLLDVDDNYAALPRKVQAMLEWALEQGYDYVFKTDDDVYLRPERLLSSLPTQNYRGRVRAGLKQGDPWYCSGMGYWLSRKAMDYVVKDKRFHISHAEDVCMGLSMRRMLVTPENDDRFVIIRSLSSNISAYEGPRQDNDVILSCEHPGIIAMQAAHNEWLNKPSMNNVGPSDPMFSRMDVLVKTFLRDGFMYRTTKAIEHFLPGARIILLDDGWMDEGKSAYYKELRSRGHVVIECDYDIGYAAKNNLAALQYDREFVLRASDDFDFADDNTIEGIRRMFSVMDSDPNVGIASGRMNNEPYEGILIQHPHSGNTPKDVVAVPAWRNGRVCRIAGTNIEYIPCDFTVNYSLIRTEIIRSMKWDETFKIGGDHMDIYLHAKEMNWDVVGIPSANVNSLKPWPGAVHPDYIRYRGRARMSLPYTYKRLNWKSFTGFDGIKHTMEDVEKWVAQNKHHFDFVPTKPGEKPAKLSEEQQKELMRDLKRMRIQSGQSMYCIKEGYQHRDTVPHYDDTPNKDEFQDHVYKNALDVYHRCRMTGKVLDIGCGSAYKLRKYFGGKDVSVMEVEPTATWLKENTDFQVLTPSDIAPKASMVICSDVIEHIEDPDELLETIKSARPEMVIISTPERSSVSGANLDGPPRNIHHYREWSREEFNKYLSGHFNIICDYTDPDDHCHVVVCMPYDPV
jgi:hypothetical protein